MNQIITVKSYIIIIPFLFIFNIQKLFNYLVFFKLLFYFIFYFSQVNASLLDTIRNIELKHKHPLMEYVTKTEMDQELGSFEEENTYSSMMHEQGDVVSSDDHKEGETGDEYIDEENEGQLYEEEVEDAEGGSAVSAKEKRNRFGHKRNDRNEFFDANIKCNEFKDEINQLRKSCMKSLGKQWFCFFKFIQ